MAERAFKYHGLGNDFVILDRRQQGGDLDERTTRELCDRRLGVGADGVLVILPSERAFARMVVHNADGSVPEMCGNGLRCVVKYLVDKGGAPRPSLSVETGAGVRHCTVSMGDQGVEQVELSMGPARLLDANLPSANGERFVASELPGFPGVRGTAVSMGNPHLVLFDREPSEPAALGPKLERAPGFPQRTNVEFCRVRDGGLDVVVWERGVGLTQACGTGACAAAAAAFVEGRLPAGDFVRVSLPGGDLSIRVAEDLSEVTLRGPATFVFEANLP